MKQYYDDNKLEQFYNFQKKYYAEIANKFWSLLSPEDYDGCYMSTSIDIGEDTYTENKKRPVRLFTGHFSLLVGYDIIYSSV